MYLGKLKYSRNRTYLLWYSFRLWNRGIPQFYNNGHIWGEELAVVIKSIASLTLLIDHYAVWVMPVYEEG